MTWSCEVEAILFDIDGTLVDSTPAVERTWRTWAADNGIDGDAIMAVSHGRRTADTLAEFIPADRIEQALQDIRVLELADMDSVVALPGAAEILGRLPGDRWAAVTSGGQELMRARLEAAGLPAPEVFIGAEDVTAGKPDPEGYLAAAAGLGVDPARCLVIEDAPAGLRAGRAAGAHVLAVATSHPAAELAGLGDAVVEKLSDLQVSAQRLIAVKTGPPAPRAKDLTGENPSRL